MSVRPRVIPGKVLHVAFNNVVRVELDLSCGVSIKRDITIEGVRAARGKDNAQMHCMVVLLGGGRNVLVHTDDTGQDIAHLSRVYLDATIKGEAPEGTMFRPYGFAEKHLEVGAYYAWLGEQQPPFDVNLVRDLLNGKRGLRV